MPACLGTTFRTGGGTEMQVSASWNRRLAIVAAAYLVVMAGSLADLSGPAAAQQSPTSSERIWTSLKGDVFGDRPILADTGLVRIEAPKRAQDAAVVPVDVYIDPAKAPDGVKSVTMIIDVNPSPVAATFQIGKEAGVTHLSTRVRVDDYSYLRAIAETQGGELHMSQTFVKASGGCSAPAVKNTDEALASMGRMKLRQFAPAAGETAGNAPELQLMIRHPNNSGLQRDPLTQYFIPAHFIQNFSISQGDRLILAMEGGISISEDPNFRFDFAPGAGSEIRVEATDTEGKVFRDQWPLEAAGL
ncbi:quinoprotein dehydrogenase-associated SoxYZ-like carrier [Mesorhizobium camelthorni]|uniref:Quinoprotein dehydrogenase-associated SoxYZ-like carrier n=2 Tax=Allomesorhizobium camelthorni TaxID=475069 RepID=A0A6G4W7X3_9HYPH|nr:quinoprotein dehydrogenase-associated SoxYZ-like carrier [Mesorhizobium camelthorni]